MMIWKTQAIPLGLALTLILRVAWAEDATGAANVGAGVEQGERESVEAPLPSDNGPDQAGAEAADVAAEQEADGADVAVEQETEGASRGEAAESEPSPTLPPIVGVPGDHFDVSFVRDVEGLEAGGRLNPGRELTLPAGSCLRLVAESAASFGLCGPTRFTVRQRGERLVLVVERGRGLLDAGEEGAALEVGGRPLVVRSGRVTFDTSASPAATMVFGEAASFDGNALEVVESRSSAAAAEVLAADWCAPARPMLTVTLGDPESLMADVEQTRRDAATSDGEGATAESGATCVDSADSSSASSPTTGDGVVIDPDVRQEDLGTLRLTIRVPTE